jgi:hypothetical protein
VVGPGSHPRHWHPRCRESGIRPSHATYPEAAGPRGDKGKYTDSRKRKSEPIEEGYKARGVPEERAEAIARATVNKGDGGGNKSGSGRGVPDTKGSSKRGGKIGGAASAARPAAARSASAKKAAATRKRRAAAAE